MNYWNKECFEGLIDIAQEFKDKNGFELFSEYCLLREKGLKKQATKVIIDFVEQIKITSTQNQRHVAVCLAELSYHRRDVHKLLPYPLEVYITDVIKVWCSEKCADAPYTWLGYLTGDDECYLIELEKNPNDQIALSRLALSAINGVDFQTHHLSESIFLGEEKKAVEALKVARNYISKMDDSENKTNLQRNIEEYDELLNAWLEFSSLKGGSNNNSFVEWCIEQDFNFGFTKAVYYDK